MRFLWIKLIQRKIKTFGALHNCFSLLFTTQIHGFEARRLKLRFEVSVTSEINAANKFESQFPSEVSNRRQASGLISKTYKRWFGGLHSIYFLVFDTLEEYTTIIEKVVEFDDGGGNMMS